MKKKILFGIAGVMALVLTGCSLDHTNEQHYVTIYDPEGGIEALYADKMDDSVIVVTTEDWSTSVSGNWITLDPQMTSGKVSSGYVNTVIIPLTMTANTTGYTRSGVVYINAYGNTLGATFVQYPMIEVTSASLKYANADKTAFTYIQTDSANCVVDTLIFNPHGNWTLSATNGNNGQKLIKSLSATSGSKGLQRVIFEMDKNTSTVDTLKDTLWLTCNEVKTPIYRFHVPRKAE